MPNDKELRILNLIFGIIITVLSVYIVISFLFRNSNTQIIIISIGLLVMGIAFTSIGIPDKQQTVQARKIEISIGSFVTIVGLICVLLSLIPPVNLLIQILILIFAVLSGIVGGAAIFAVSSENWTKTKSRWIMVGMGIIMIIICVINVMLFGFGISLQEDFNLIIIILIFITFFIHGFSRIIIYYTGIY